MTSARLRAPSRTRNRAGTLRRALSLVAVAAVLGSLFVVGAREVQPAHAVPNQITGLVFRDYNTNGLFEASAVPATSSTPATVAEVPIAGVTVTAYNGADQVVGTTTTLPTATASVNYTLTVSGVAANAPLRIEFTDYPDGFIDSYRAVASTLIPSRTSVQFIQLGANGTSGVNFALHKATDLAKAGGTPIITAVQSPGPSTGARSGSASLTLIRRSQAYSGSGTPGTPTALTTFGNTGAVWGVAAQPLPRTSPTANEVYNLYASAVVKRHSGLGPRGIAGLYRVATTIDYDQGTLVGTPTVTSVNLMGGAGSSVSYGTLTRASDALTSPALGGTDATAFGAVGRVGIGGIAVSGDTIYVVNLFDRNVYAYAVSSLNFTTAGGTPTVAPTLIATGLPVGQAPWAITVHEGSLYLGVTATNGSTARVLERPLTGATAWTEVLSVPLGYERGISWSNVAAIATGQEQSRWHAWQDDPATLHTVSRVGGWAGSWSLHAWGQPMLSGLAFDDGGNLTLGIADRFGFQAGNLDPWPGQATDVVATPVGDTLYAGRSATGEFVLENASTAANAALVTTTAASGAILPRLPSYTGTGDATIHADQTIRQNIQRGGREFFEDSVRWNGAGGIDGQGVVHDETTLGAVASLPGLDELVSSSYDAVNEYNAAGNRFLSLVNGRSVGGFDQYLRTQTGTEENTFGKGGGIGGISVLVTDAPVEIGNRVWFDADNDGIQDADEPAINNVTVSLYLADAAGAPTGAVISTTTTATVNSQAGTYYFRTVDGGGPAGFVKNRNYVVVFAAPATISPSLVWPTGTAPAGFSGLTGAMMRFTTQNAGDDTVDSDANPANGRVLVSVGSVGENDHTIDAGYVAGGVFRLQKSVVGTVAPGTTFTVRVSAATNFRGESILNDGTQPSSDATIDTLEYALTPGAAPISSEAGIPFGTTLTFDEPGFTGAGVAFSPALTPTNDDAGTLTITPNGGATGPLLSVTNSVTSMTFTKALSTPVTLPTGTTFPLEYRINGVDGDELQIAVGQTLTLDALPFGATVSVREPLVGPFSWGGYAWTSGTWRQGTTALVPDADGWVTVTANANTTPVAVTLTNHAQLPPSLPFTGGLASDTFTIAGTIVVALALGLGACQGLFVRRRRPGAHRA